MTFIDDMIMEIISFNEQNFIIFPEHERSDLRYIWNQAKSVVEFIRGLSPDHKRMITTWARRRAAPQVDPIALRSVLKDIISTLPKSKKSNKVRMLFYK